MRIHSVHLKNLNSLYGEHSVDFVRELGDAPLFLIVGPTGAGKSTIMDAVSLALFGTTPRLSGKSGDDDARMVMSRGTGRCAASVVFSKQTSARTRKLYRAEWECWRSRDDPTKSFQKPRRALFELDPLGIEQTLVDDNRGKFFDPVFSEVLEGLEPDEFRRSMLLAQGQFSAFLRASVEERAAILERLTSTERYRDIGARAMLRWQQAKETRDGLGARVEAIELLSADALAQLAADAEAVTKEVADAEAAYRRHDARLNWRKRWAFLNDELTLAKRVFDEAQQRWDRHADKRDTLAEADRCAAASELLRSVEALRKELRIAQARTAEAQEQREARGRAVEVANHDAQTSADLLRSALQTALGAPVEPERDLDAALAEARDALAEARERLVAQRTAITRHAELQQELQRLDARKTQRAERRAQAEARASKAAQAAQEATAEQARLDALLEAKRETQLALAVIVDLDAKRDALEEGEPCPLCGATDHPWAGDASVGAQAEDRLKACVDAIRALSAERDAQRKRGDQAATERARAETELQATEQAEQDDSEARERTVATIATLSAQVADTDLDAVTRALDALRVTATDLQAAADAYDKASDAATAAGGALARIEATVTERASTESSLRERAEAGVHALEEALAALGFNNVRQLEQHALAPDERAALARSVADTTSKRDEARGRFDALTAQLANHTDARPKGGDDLERAGFDELEAQATAALAALTQAQERRAVLSAQLQQQREAHDKRSDLITAYERAEADLGLWDELRKLIGSSEGAAFQRFAQTLNLAELVDKANVRLQELAPRYALVVAKDRDGIPLLSFAVMDHEHADRIRPQTTLSGGETFLVSLSLALALSDYRQTRMPIETLLLDEGFGTLDAETLDVAMSALERLCAAGGTQIGVISHVEALKERIAAQVTVEKLGGGRSRLRVQHG